MAVPNVLKLAGSPLVEDGGLLQRAPSAANTVGQKTALSTFVIPAGALANDGDSIEFEYFGTWGLADNSAISLDFGSIAGAATADFAKLMLPAESAWLLRGRISRVRSQVQSGINEMLTDHDGNVALSVGDFSEDETQPITMVLYGETDAGGSITLRGSRVAFNPVS